jgi:hypothetical protein
MSSSSKKDLQFSFLDEKVDVLSILPSRFTDFFSALPIYHMATIPVRYISWSV